MGLWTCSTAKQEEKEERKPNPEGVHSLNCKVFSVYTAMRAREQYGSNGEGEVKCNNNKSGGRLRRGGDQCGPIDPWPLGCGECLAAKDSVVRRAHSNPLEPDKNDIWWIRNLCHYSLCVPYFSSQYFYTLISFSFFPLLLFTPSAKTKANRSKKHSDPLSKTIKAFTLG